MIAPRVLTKLNKARNLLEHEFTCPSREDVEDFIDIVSLFIESTKIYFYNVLNEIEYELENSNLFVRLKIIREKPEFLLDVMKGKPFRVNISNDLYYDVVKTYVGTICEY